MNVNIPTNSGEHGHNEVDKSNINLYLCNVTAPTKQCLSLVAELLSCSSADQRLQFVELPKSSVRKNFDAMGKYDKHSLQTFYRVWHIQCTIIVTLLAVTLARALVRCILKERNCNTFAIWCHYVLDFIIISLPVIVSVNVANSYVELIVLLGFLIIILIMWRTKCWKLAAEREYKCGRRPLLFTLIRSSINIITAVCILAIDFKSFPKEFRKTRRYGVGLMDIGIGMFVFSMGLVASRPRKFSDLRKLVLTIGCLLTLGLSRTLVITAIDYHQDEHEYGVHLNAFFTLGLTKLFATIIGFLIKSNNYFIGVGVVILLLHETILQFGVWKYVMNTEIERNNIINANREGIFSLPGFVALYLLSQYLGAWIQTKDVLNFEEIKNKLKALCLTTLILWLLVTLAIFVIGIARVTCNLGYVLWILAVAMTLITLYFFLFDIVLDTLIIRTHNEAITVNLTGTNSKNSFFCVHSKIPLILEAINFNGLTFFLLANILTGCTNIFLATDDKTNLESIFILFIYMLIVTTVICILHFFKIRIA